MVSTAGWAGAYQVLWDIFGGTVNEKGYKVLNPKVGIIYGDSITLERQKEIYKMLEEKDFAATNLVLGVRLMEKGEKSSKTQRLMMVPRNH